MSIYLLDTNIASHIIKGDILAVRQRLAALPMRSIFLSAVSQAELAYGVAKRGHPVGLTTRVREFLARVGVLPWTSEVADVYGELRASCEARGISLGSLDMMIAAHARAESAVLVTRDKAFSHLSAELQLENWAAP